MKKNVLYFREIASGLDSGMTIQILNDYGYLSQLGNDVHVPIYLKDAAKKGELQRYAEGKGFQRLVTLQLRSGIRKLRAAECLISFLAAVLSDGPSGCIIVVRESKYLLLARLLRFFFRTPVVSELHEGGLPVEENAPVRSKFRRLFDTVDGLVFTNFSQAQYLKDRGYCLPEKSIVLPNGVDAGKFSLAEPAAPGSPDVVMTYVGQFTSWKNLPLLFAALQHLPANFRLRLAGGKIDARTSRDYVEGLERKYDVEGRVDFLGFVHPDRVVSDVLSGSSVLVLPLGEGSIAQFATSPMKLVEYMATPIPIVAVTAPSVTGLTGTDTVYLSEMNARAFADAVQRAVQDHAGSQERIARGNAVAMRYDHRERAARYNDWLNTLLPSAAQ